MLDTQETLLEKSKLGDEQAIGDLILNHKNLVKSIVRKYFLVGSDMDDLMQEGMIGLYKAILSYDKESNVKFTAYAKLCISRQVFNAIKQANTQNNQVLNSSIMLGGQGEIDFFSGEDDEEENAIVVAMEQENPESVALKKERMKTFYDSVEKYLDEKDTEILHFYLDGLSYSEIANKMDCTNKNIDNALTRIKLRIKKGFENV